LKTVLCIPTLNAAETVDEFLSTLKVQTHQPDVLLIIDSESCDGTDVTLRNAGAVVHVIARDTFGHGRTRQLAVEKADKADIVIFMTQDAILARPDSIERLLGCFTDENVGMAYGRQLPSPMATHIAAHARLFNYPENSMVRSKSDISTLGIKAAFCSNTFAAYRLSALDTVEGFPPHVIFGEDTIVAAKMLQNGWGIAYCSEAMVYHSHNYSYCEEFRRYFDIGVFHSQEKWFLESLGTADREGKRYLISEMKYLLKHSPCQIPSAMLRTILKYVGYKLGRMESRLSVSVKKMLSMNKAYWK